MSSRDWQSDFTLGGRLHTGSPGPEEKRTEDLGAFVARVEAAVAECRALCGAEDKKAARKRIDEVAEALRIYYLGYKNNGTYRFADKDLPLLETVEALNDAYTKRRNLCGQALELLRGAGFNETLDAVGLYVAALEITVQREQAGVEKRISTDTALLDIVSTIGKAAAALV